MARSVPPILGLLKSYLVSGKAASYTIFYDDDTTSLLSPEIYNLFIVATLITLFIWFFRIAIKDRHIKDLGSHLASNNALVFDVLGTDVDILKQFTPEHLLKYLEYNSGCEPIPIEQVPVPCALNRESLSLATSGGGGKSITFSVDATSRFCGQLFWSVPASSFKRCCKDLATMICTKDPTFQRSFMNPFAEENSNQSEITFTEVLNTLCGQSRNGHSPVFSSTSTESFSFPIPERMLSEITSYHLNANSFAIFSEKLTDPAVLRQVNSQTSLLRMNPSTSTTTTTTTTTTSSSSSSNRSNRSNRVISHPTTKPNHSSSSSTTTITTTTTTTTTMSGKKAGGRSHLSTSNEILPLLMVMWDEPSSSSSSPSSSPVDTLMSEMTMNQQDSSSSLPTSTTLSTSIPSPKSSKSNKSSKGEKTVFFSKRQRGENTSQSIPKNSSSKPRFIQILVVHFLRAVTPTLIRRINICADGVFIPRSIYTSNGTDQGKNEECIICFSNNNDIILLPCRHKLVCRSCVCMIKQCPFCRGCIASYIREGDNQIVEDESGMVGAAPESLF